MRIMRASVHRPYVPLECAPRRLTVALASCFAQPYEDVRETGRGTGKRKPPPPPSHTQTK